MPKIAILAPRYGLIERGVETFTKDLVNHLKTSFEFEIVSRQNTWCLPWFHQEFEMFTFSVCALPRLLAGNHDLIFCQSGFWGAVVCNLVRLIKKTKFIYRSAGGCEPWIVRMRPDVYIATTPQIELWIKNFSSRQKTVLIPNGVDTKLFTPFGPKIKLSLPRPIVLCVAADIPAKRIDLAKRAVVAMRKGSLLAIGHGNLQVPHHEMPKYYRSADIFTLPSWEEPFGIVYLEALACGLPVVAPRDASRRYILGSNAVYCDVENISAYAKALSKASKNKMDKRWLEKFSWAKVARKYKKLFCSIINCG